MTLQHYISWKDIEEISSEYEQKNRKRTKKERKKKTKQKPKDD